MKYHYTKEEILNNVGCWYHAENRIEKIYTGAGIEFSDDTIISIQDILNFKIPLRRKVWFLVNKAELSEEEMLILRTSLEKIVLPIFVNKYPEVEIDMENAFMLANEGDEEAYNVAMAHVYELHPNACMYAAHAAQFCSDKTFESDILNYLLSFTKIN